jgi:hypothetical protein
MLHMRLALAAASLLILTGCVVAPAPYGYGYAPGYYGPAYVAAPPIVVGGGWRGGRW